MWLWCSSAADPAKSKSRRSLTPRDFSINTRVAQVRSLNLGNGLDVQLIPECLFRVQPESLAGSCSAGTTGPLLGIRLRDGSDLKGVHAHLRVVHFQFREAGVNDVNNAIDCKTRFGDVCCHDALPYPRRRLVEDLRLKICRHLTVQRQYRSSGASAKASSSRE